MRHLPSNTYISCRKRGIPHWHTQYCLRDVLAFRSSLIKGKIGFAPLLLRFCTHAWDTLNFCNEDSLKSLSRKFNEIVFSYHDISTHPEAHRGLYRYPDFQKFQAWFELRKTCGMKELKSVAKTFNITSLPLGFLMLKFGNNLAYRFGQERYHIQRGHDFFLMRDTKGGYHTAGRGTRYFELDHIEYNQ